MDDRGKMGAGAPSEKSRRALFAFVPLILFLVLAAVFFTQLTSGRDASAIPSALIGSVAPNTNLPELENIGLPGLKSEDFLGNVTLVNVFASWCGPCRDEHPVLMELAQDKRFKLAALNYKDKPENASRFLGQLGNPYQLIGVDSSGRTAIDWGVYGVPETFIVGKDGKIAYKSVGPLTPGNVKNGLLPAIEAALAQP